MKLTITNPNPLKNYLGITVDTPKEINVEAMSIAKSNTLDIKYNFTDENGNPLDIYFGGLTDFNFQNNTPEFEAIALPMLRGILELAKQFAVSKGVDPSTVVITE